jgi:HEAT repeat protein
VPAVAPWTAHPQGFLQVRGSGAGEFVYWNQKSYSVAAIAKTLGSGRRIPLDEIADPVARIRVAEERLGRGDVGDEKAFVRGLMLNVQDPDGQAKRVARPAKGGVSTDTFGMTEGQAQPHALWYNSLALLRDFGKDAARTKAVVAALTPVARTAKPTIRLAAALALVDLGSDAGRAALVEGFEKDSGQVSSEPPDPTIFPGRYPYDGSSVTACAHALARLGDRRGLKHSRVDVRLATAEALTAKADGELRAVLDALSKELQPNVDKLRAGGELTKPRHRGDYTNRYPDDWIRTQRLLARVGDGPAFQRLVEAYITDAGTYPKQETPLVPVGQPVSWSSGPSPASAVVSVEERPSVVLDRLKQAYGSDPRWSGPALSQLRSSLERPQTDTAQETPRPKPTDAEVAKLLSDPDANRRAEGLAAAGYHQLAAFRPKVLDAALRGKGVERNAAVYALGFYAEDVPESVLRELVADKDLQLRFSAVELATRKNAGRFARETMELARAQLAHAAKAKPDDFDAQHSVEYLPRLVCRLAQGPLPQPLLDGLKDPNPAVRRIVLQGLEFSGNPDAVPHLRTLETDADPAVREAAKAALLFIGPAD